MRIETMKMGVFRVNTTNNDHSRIEKGVESQGCTGKMTAHGVRARLAGERFETHLGRLRPHLSKKRDVIANLDATRLGCLRLNGADVEVKWRNIWLRNVNGLREKQEEVECERIEREAERSSEFHKKRQRWMNTKREALICWYVALNGTYEKKKSVNNHISLAVFMTNWNGKEALLSSAQKHVINIQVKLFNASNSEFHSDNFDTYSG